jgi:hypothetical protein
VNILNIFTGYDLLFVQFLFIYGAGMEPSPLLMRSFIGLFCQSWMIDGDDCGLWSN